MPISDTGKADAQPLSPEVWEAQAKELAWLSQAVQAAEVENQGLRARVAELGVRQCDALKALLQSVIKEYDDAPASAGTERNRAIALLARGWPVFGVGMDECRKLTDEEYGLIFDAQAEMRRLRHEPETPQNPSICPQEVPVPVSTGDSTPALRNAYSGETTPRNPYDVD